MKKNCGFSLVELSIVLVILGLLVGGILAGQSLIRASELRSVTTDLNRYQTAIMAFRDKYFYLPGDLPNATAFWGAVNATPSVCRATASTGGKTCDGNGDGYITTIDGVTESEWFHAWIQLADAGVIEGGNYTGIKSAAGLKSATAGVNVPAGRISNSGYSLLHYDLGPAVNNNKELIYFGTNSTQYTYGPVMTPAEAWNLDTKMDDGNNATGRFTANWGTGFCYNGSGYMLSSSVVDCSIIWAVN